MKEEGGYETPQNNQANTLKSKIYTSFGILNREQENLQKLGLSTRIRTGESPEYWKENGINQSNIELDKLARAVAKSIGRNIDPSLQAYLANVRQKLHEATTQGGYIVNNGVKIKNYLELSYMENAAIALYFRDSSGLQSAASGHCWNYLAFQGNLQPNDPENFLWKTQIIIEGSEEKVETQIDKKRNIRQYSQIQLTGLSQEIQPSMTRKENRKLRNRLNQDAEYFVKQSGGKQRLVYNPKEGKMVWVDKVA